LGTKKKKNRKIIVIKMKSFEIESLEIIENIFIVNIVISLMMTMNDDE